VTHYYETRGYVRRKYAELLVNVCVNNYVMLTQKTIPTAFTGFNTVQRPSVVCVIATTNEPASGGLQLCMLLPNSVPRFPPHCLFAVIRLPYRISFATRHSYIPPPLATRSLPRCAGAAVQRLMLARVGCARPVTEREPASIVHVSITRHRCNMSFACLGYVPTGVVLRNCLPWKT
jgi:hypothetical protein